jgi:hypothetical protein
VVLRASLVCSLSLLLSGCFIAKDGPTGSEIRASSEVTLDGAASPLSYALVKVSPQVIEGLNNYTTARAHGFASAP